MSKCDDIVSAWESEVEEETARLVEKGFPANKGIRQAERIVARRKRRYRVVKSGI